MTDLREAAQMALNALEWCYDVTEWPANGNSSQDKAIEALRVALAQPEQRTGNCLLTGVCAAEGHRIQKAQREWQGLTDEEIESLFVWQEWSEDFAEYEPVARAIEAKLKEKNNG